MAIDVHQCPRCELRFRNSAELRDHFSHDHHADPDTFDRYRYQGRSDMPPPPVGPRYLVVGNQTLHDERLGAALEERAAQPGASFFVLVPATHSGDLHRPPADATAPDDPHAGDDVGLALARWRLRTMIDRLHDRGIHAEGQVGHPDPFTAVSRVLDERSFDEIVLSTLPVSVSRWLDVDLPKRLERRFGLPVTTIAVEAARSS